MTNAFRELFDEMAADISQSLGNKGLEYAHRTTAVHADVPVYGGDVRGRQRIAREAIAIVLRGGDPRDMLAAYSLPEMHNLIQNDRDVWKFNQAAVAELKRVLAFTPVDQSNVLNLNSNDLSFSRSRSGRLSIQSSAADLSNRTFDPERMILALLCSVQQQTGQSDAPFLVPYPHVVEETSRTKIASKTLFVLSQRQVDELRRFCMTLM